LVPTNVIKLIIVVSLHTGCLSNFGFEGSVYLLAQGINCNCDQKDYNGENGFC
jgi:hypothetical protein